MPDEKLSALGTFSLALGDLLYAVDISDTSVDPGGKEGKQTVSSLGSALIALGLVVNAAYVDGAIAALINSSPSTLNTLSEIATALGNDPNLATTLTTLIGTKAPINNPNLTGIPLVPTASLGTNTQQIASTAFVKQSLDALLDSPPGALDTLNELAAALNDDASFAATVTTALAGKASLGPNTFMGDQNLGGHALLNFIPGFDTVVGTTYTLQSTDNGKVKTFTNSSSISVTVPNSLIPGFSCLCLQKGVGQITFSAASSGNLRNRQSHTKTAGQYAGATIYIESNAGTAPEIYLSGDTAA